MHTTLTGLGLECIISYYVVGQTVLLNATTCRTHKAIEHLFNGVDRVLESFAGGRGGRRRAFPHTSLPTNPVREKTSGIRTSTGTCGEESKREKRVSD